MKFSDQIRRAVDESGMTRAEICRQIELDEAVLSRFMSGKGGLSVQSMDRLGACLKLKVVPNGKSRK